MQKCVNQAYKPCVILVYASRNPVHAYNNTYHKLIQHQKVHSAPGQVADSAACLFISALQSLVCNADQFISARDGALVESYPVQVGTYA